MTLADVKEGEHVMRELQLGRCLACHIYEIIRKVQFSSIRANMNCELETFVLSKY